MLTALDPGASHLALAVSRILYHAAVFWLMWDLWWWRAAAFADHPAAAAVLLPLALVTNAALVLGAWTRLFQLVNAVLVRVLFALCLDSYTADEVVENASLVFALAPAPRALSLDSWRRGDSAPGEAVPRWFVLLLFTSLALIYADGLPAKLESEVWRSGAAFWLGAALPHFSTGLLPAAAEVGWLMKACTYGALVYEAGFPLILVRRLRPVWSLLGLMVHVGSGVFMALPQFALVMSALVAFLGPWDRGRPRGAPAAAPRWAAWCGYTLIALMVVGQLSLRLWPTQPRNLLCRALGVYPRAIFVDWHFRLPGPLLRFTAVSGDREIAIPSFDAQGYPTTHDRYWKLFGFTLRTGLPIGGSARRYMAAWLARAGRPATEIRVYCRDATVASLSLDFSQDDEHRQRPWRLCGRLVLTGAQR